MRWYHYLACYFAGFWGLNLIPHLLHGIPHLLHGISGQAFPTPFASPPAVGLSSPLVNVAWALSNLLLTYVLGRAGKLGWAGRARPRCWPFSWALPRWPLSWPWWRPAACTRQRPGSIDCK